MSSSESDLLLSGKQSGQNGLTTNKGQYYVVVTAAVTTIAALCGAFFGVMFFFNDVSDLSSASTATSSSLIRTSIDLDVAGSNDDNCESILTSGGFGCGGDNYDPTYQASCTPYSFRAAVGSQSSAYSSGFCTDQSVKDFAGADQKSGSDASDSFAVWYDHSQADDDDSKNYWVIHGCDGSGVQVGDCMGGTGYVEQIGNYSPKYANWNNGNWNQKVVTIENGTGDGKMDAHVQSPFIHPGTNKVYGWAAMGMWTMGGSDWPEHIKPWWDMQGIPETKYLGPDNAIFFSLYPWVCNIGTQDLSWMWNGGGNGKQMDLIYGTSNAKCYYDNEPYTNGHDDKSLPPVSRHYKFTRNGDDLIGWLLYEKKYESGGPTDDYTDKCGDGCDGDCKNNGYCFNLQRLDSIPW